MTPSPFGAARPRVDIRPRTREVPLGIVHPDDAFADGDDYRWSLYEEEQAQDRLYETGDRVWVAVDFGRGEDATTLIALPVGERDQRQAA